ncbi:MAG: hypothetical protein B6U65_00825 [Candidatus Wolframiiraptor sp. EX4484-121]|nr:MAG: hypothetical protein B6U65_00825 [Candidatus Wolframiiraptor sp. EX4484-121]
MSIYLCLLVLAVGWLLAYLILRGVFSRESLGNLKLYPLAFVLRSRGAVDLFDKVVDKSPLLWRVLSNIGVAVGFGLTAFSIYFLTRNLGTYLFAPQQVGPQNIVVPLIIGVTIRLEHLPYILLALGIVLITHEGMHGLVARLEKIRLKSTGLFLAFIFPGGFVEPDEEEFNKAPPKTKMRVAAAGSFANLVVGLLAVFLIMGLFLPMESGVMVLEVEGDAGGIHVGDVIVGVNGVAVNRDTLFQNITAKDVVVVKTMRGNISYRLKKPINMPMAWVLRGVGVKRIDYYRPMRIHLGAPMDEYNIYRMFWWIQLVALGVAIFNMLPIYFLDGSLFLSSLLESWIRDERKLKVFNIGLTSICITLLALNIAFTYKTFGFFQL